MKAAFDVLGPKIEKSNQIGTMVLETASKFGSKHLIATLVQLQEHLNVSKLDLRADSTHNLMPILSLFNAQVLKELRLGNNEREKPLIVGGELYESSQFKNLASLEMWNFGVVRTVDLRKLYHLEEISVTVKEIGEGTIIELIEAFRRSSTARKWIFKSENSLEIDERFRNKLGDLIDEDNDSPMCEFRVQIANAKKKMYFILGFSSFAISNLLFGSDDLIYSIF